MSTTKSDIAPIKAFMVPEAKAAVQDWFYIPAPLGPNQVEIKIEACGCCHSDVHSAHNDWGFSTYPLVPGHEIIGRVIAVGTNVTERKIGDRVGVTPQVGNCGECEGCQTGQTNLCPGLMTNQVYGSPLDDVNQKFTYGGFAERIRVAAKWAFLIPDALPSIAAAPLLCAGCTVWGPLAHYKVGKGQKVGIVGIGGLGHIAVQFASKLGAEVYAITTTSDKGPLAKQLGATDVLVISDEKAVQAAAGTFDFILCTVSNSSAPWDAYLTLLKAEAKFILVGAPTTVSFNPFALLMKRVIISGHGLATHQQIIDMLDFAAKHNVTAMAEQMEMTADNITKAFELVDANKPRFRIVLVNKP